MDREPTKLGGVEISRGEEHRPLYVWVERRVGCERWVVCAPKGIPLVTSREDVAVGWHRITAEEFSGANDNIDAIELRRYDFTEAILFEGYKRAEAEAPEDASATG